MTGKRKEGSEGEEEGLAIVAELRSESRPAESVMNMVVSDISRAVRVAHGVSPAVIALIAPRTVRTPLNNHLHP